MRKLYLLITAFFFAGLQTTVAADFVKNGNSVTIQVQNPQKDGARVVCLEVINDNIIRVRATMEESFPEKKSLIIVPQTTKPKFEVNEDGKAVYVKAAGVQAVVDKASGDVAFFDAQGKKLIQEEKNGKQFKPFRVPERELGVPQRQLSEKELNGLTWHLQFQPEQALKAVYGLGQHQAEEYNMLGKNEELYQYNTKVSVPFVMTNLNFGLLWDSYSLGRWGNPNDYLQLNRAFKLYDKNGKPGQLTGTYMDKDGKKIVRGEDSIYFEYDCPSTSKIGNATDNGGIKNLPKGFNLDGAQVVYDGFIEAPESDIYHFILYYAGYVKVYVGGKEVVPERWRTAWNPNSWKFVAKLQKGKRTQLRIEWKPDGGVSYCGLRVAPLYEGVPSSRMDKVISIWSEMSRDMDYYFIAGKNMDEVISGYRTLTGKASLYPKWVLGFWQSRERYKTSGEIESTLAEFRKRHIPVDNIVQDWNYWRLPDWGSHTFEAARFPNPQAMLDSVHQMNGRFMISVWPKFYDTVDNYKELDSKGWIYHQAITDDIHDWLGFTGSFYDAYDAGARKVFWRQMNDNLYSKFKYGIDAWWMDASEPNVRDCTPIWYRKALSGPTALGTSTEYFNAYSIVNADAIYNGQRSVNPNQRVFLLTRSGFAGEQRYSTATWSGDIGTRWEDMRSQMTAGLNYSMSGLPFWGMDQGGFSVENRYVKAQQVFDQTGVETADLTEWRELQTRWNQFGCFIPLYRAHGQWPLREVWNIAPEDHPAYKTIVWYDKLRYHLMPYLYSMAGWVHFRDYTMMRGLAMDFNDDEQVYDIPDQWMFGPAFMACPVGYYQARNRSVYFPSSCGWYDLYTGQHIDGGQTLVVDAPYERMPVFVREGSIVPFGPEMEWSDEKPAELINLYVYQGADACFQLYEDEGTNYNYEKGKYATIDMKYDEATKTLTIGKRAGNFKGMLKNRRFNVVVVSPGKATPLNLQNPDGMMVNYEGKELKIQL